MVTLIHTSSTSSTSPTSTPTTDRKIKEIHKVVRSIEVGSDKTIIEQICFDKVLTIFVDATLAQS